MLPDNSKLSRLDSHKTILPFDCNDADLNDFLHHDSKNYLSQLLAVTYTLETDNETIAFYSVSNDKISVEEVKSGNRFKRFKANFTKEKQLRSYPAVKIGRFGVSTIYKGQHIGTALLDYIKLTFINNNRTGCRYITVDAYAESLKFYEKNGFQYMTDTDIGHETRLMYFELTPLM